MAIQLGDAILRIRANTTELNTKLNQMKSDVSKNFGAVLDAGRKIGMGLAAVGGGIVAGLGLAVKESIKFESAFAGIRKTVKASEPEFKMLENQIKQLSTEIPVSANELAKIGEIAGQLGIKKENIISFTDTIAKLGVATNISGEEGAMMLAQFATITQLPQDKFENLASAIVDLGNNSQTTEKDIMNMAMRIAGAGTTVGITPPKIIGVAAALSSLGIEAEAGGTAFSQLVIKMQMAVRGKGLPTEEIEKLNEKLTELTDSHNQKMEQLSDRLKDVNGRIRELRAEAMQSAYEDRMQSQIQAARRAGNEAYANALEAELERSRQIVKQQQFSNQLQEAYAEKAKLEQEMAKENSEFEKAAKKIQSLLNGSGEVLQGFAKVSGVSVEEFKRIFEEDATKAVEMFLTGLGKIQAAKGDVGGALQELGLDGIRMVSTLLSASNAQNTFSDAVARGAKAFEENKALANEAAERFKTMESQLQMLKNSWTNLMSEVGKAVLPVLAAIGAFLKPIIEGLTAWVKNNPELAGTIIIVVGALASIAAAIGALLIVLPLMVEGIGILGTALTFLFANPIGLVILGIAALIAAGYFLIKNWDTVKETAKTIWQGMCDGILAIWELFQEGLKRQFTAIGFIVGTAFKFIVKLITNPRQAIKEAWDGILSVWDWVVEKLQWIGGIIYDLVTYPWRKAIELIRMLWSAFTGGFMSGFTAPSPPSAVPANARGTSFFKGGLTTLAEEGPELVMGPGLYSLPRGSRVFNANETRNMLGKEQSVNNSFNISNLVVREEADIKKIAHELYRMQMRTSRAQGLA